MRLPLLLDLRRPRMRALWALALSFTLLNAVKPLVIDDAAYYCYARQIHGDPLHPYSFSMFWYQWPHPANEVLAPPVLPYWWAVGLALFGENAFLWKLWLFPFGLLFVAALDGLLRRFARNAAGPVLWMTVLSPTFLPGFNLMLDVPALALSLTSLTVFFRAYNRGSMRQAAAAGLLAGLAMETKYTAFLAPAVMLLYTVFFWGRPWAVNFRRRVVPGLVSVLVAAVFFLACEAAIARSCGESHFLCNLKQNSDTFHDKVYLIVPLLLVLGCLSPPVVLLSLVALGASRRVVFSAGAVPVLGYIFVVALSPSAPVRVALEERFSCRALGGVSLEDLVFAVFSLVTLGTAAATLLALCLLRPELEIRAATDWFLVLWFGGEILGCVALTPFPAARRVMGIVLVGTLIAARLASRVCRSAPRQRLLRGVAAFGVVLGFTFYAIDLDGAFAEKEAAEQAARAVRRMAVGPDTVWYVGHWGFQHYAEREGMKPVIPDQSYLRPGDWLVVPDGEVNRQEILVDSNCAERVDTFGVDGAFAARTLPNFYGGRTPFRRAPGPHLTVSIYRVTREFVPASDRARM